MRIFRISTRGLKSLRSQELTELRDLSTYNVLIGPNNAGKSALLDSIGLLRATISTISDTGLYSRNPSVDTITFEVGLELAPEEVKTLGRGTVVQEVPDERLHSLSRWSFLFAMRQDAPSWPNGQAGLQQWRLLVDDQYHEIGSVIQTQDWSSTYESLLVPLVIRAAEEPKAWFQYQTSSICSCWA